MKTKYLRRLLFWFLKLILQSSCKTLMIVLQYIAQTYLFKRAHYVGISTIFKNETSPQLKFTEMCLRRVLNRDQISHNESPAQLESCLMPKNDLTRRWSLFSSHHKDRELGLSAVRLNTDGWLLSAMVQTLHPWFAGRATAGSINPKLLRLICLQAISLVALQCSRILSLSFRTSTFKSSSLNRFHSGLVLKAQCVTFKHEFDTNEILKKCDKWVLSLFVVTSN